MMGRLRLGVLVCAVVALVAAAALARPEYQVAAQAPSTVYVYLPLVLKNYTPPPPPVTPNDPRFLDGSQWGLYNNGQNGGLSGADIKAPQAWAITTGGANVIVAVVDSGVDADHPDLVGKLLPGRNFLDDAPDPANTDDDHGHGTHVVGIAAASSNNAVGIAGVSWGARILPVKVLDGSGKGYVSDVADGIRYAADNGARVINLSLGYQRRIDDGEDPTLAKAIAYAYGKGVLLVASAGNCGDPTNLGSSCPLGLNGPGYPAWANHVLAVGATTNVDSRASFSTQGDYVDVAAPGLDILSTWPNSISPYNYKTSSGTSMATPFVSGLAALLASLYPGYTPDQLAQAIVNNADDLGPINRDDGFGCGRINAQRALANGAVASGCNGWSGYAADSEAPAAAGAAGGQSPFREGVLLVKFKDPATAKARGLVREAVPGLGIYEIKVPPGQELAKRSDLANDPAVESVEVDHVVYALEAAD